MTKPLTIEKAAGFKPVACSPGIASVFMRTTIPTRRKIVRRNRIFVQRFVDASIAGWADYLNGDPTRGDALIKRANPEMTDALLAYGRAKMKEYGIVKSGDTSNARHRRHDGRRGCRSFFEQDGWSRVYSGRQSTVTKAYALQFVNEGWGWTSAEELDPADIARLDGAIHERGQARCSGRAWRICLCPPDARLRGLTAANALPATHPGRAKLNRSRAASASAVRHWRAGARRARSRGPRRRDSCRCSALRLRQVDSTRLIAGLIANRRRGTDRLARWRSGRSQRQIGFVFQETAP